MNEHQVATFLTLDGVKKKGMRMRKTCYRLEGRIYSGNPIVSTPLSNPIHIATKKK